MKKNTFRIILDTIMAVILVLLYKKNVLGLTFHEAAGILVCLLVIVHVCVNREWVAGITKNLFKKGTPAKSRILWIVDTLFALCFLGILITGIGISKKLFPQLAFIAGRGVPYHEFFGAVALVLLGIHLGLHWKWIHGMVTGSRKVPKAVRALSWIALVAALGYGAYSLGASSVGQWLSGPFSDQSAMAAAHGHGPGMGMGMGQGGGAGFGQPVTAQGVVLLFVRFACIVVLFAAVAAFIEWLVVRRKKAEASEPSAE